MHTNHQSKRHIACPFGKSNITRRKIVDQLFMRLISAIEKTPAGFNCDMQAGDPFDTVVKTQHDGKRIRAYADDYRLIVGCDIENCVFFKKHYFLGECSFVHSIDVPRNYGQTPGGKKKP